MSESARPQATQAAEDEPAPVGLGGWLILVGIGVVVSPFVIGLSSYGTFMPIFEDGSWEYLTTPGTEGYHSWWGPVVIGEIAFNFALLVGHVILIALFFLKKKLFPSMYILLVVINIVGVLADAAIAKVLLPDIPFFDEETKRTLLRSLFSAMIWVPYMHVSRRVKATFVN